MHSCAQHAPPRRLLPKQLLWARHCWRRVQGRVRLTLLRLTHPHVPEQRRLGYHRHRGMFRQPRCVGAGSCCPLMVRGGTSAGQGWLASWLHIHRHTCLVLVVLASVNVCRLNILFGLLHAVCKLPPSSTIRFGSWSNTCYDVEAGKNCLGSCSAGETRLSMTSIAPGGRPCLICGVGALHPATSFHSHNRSNWMWGCPLH